MGGHCYFVDSDGVETKAEYSFGYSRDANDPNKIRIIVHHSSVPYEPPQTGWFYYIWRFLFLALLAFVIGTRYAATKVTTSSTTSFLARWVIAVRQIERNV